MAPKSQVIPLPVIARACREANRVLQRLNGEEVSPTWDEAPDWMRKSSIDGVKVALGGSTPEQNHEAWCQSRMADGWAWGAVKDMTAKLHPCLVPYSVLPLEQRAKDEMFCAIAGALTAGGQR